MRRLTNEDGAVALILAIFLPVLLGMAAMAVDVSRLYQERRELQNGADAAVLAIAENCARAQIASALDPDKATLTALCINATASSLPGMPPMDGSAQAYATANADSDHIPNAAVDPPTFSGITADEVTVRTSKDVDFLFAPVIDMFDNEDGDEGEHDGDTVTAAAKAIWAAVETAPARPITMDASAYVAGGAAVLDFDSSSGAFGWLSSDDCFAHAASGGSLSVGDPMGDTDPGTSTPSTLGCTPADFKGTIQVPAYDDVTGTGTGTSYRVVGFASVEVSQFRLTGDPANWCWAKPPLLPDCTGRYIRGTFVDYVALDGTPTTTPGATSFGTIAIALVNVTD